jgi:glutathione S-transferase/3-isopropylmalate dehydratase
MGAPYRVELADLRNPSPAFAAANPLGSLPAMQDGDVTMTESIAIMLYVMETYGPTSLALKPGEPGHADYLQYLIFGEAGLGMNGNPVIAAKFLAPEGDKQNWSVRNCLERFTKRIGVVEQRLADRPYMAGDQFTAADISVGYALGLSDFVGAGALPPRCARYVETLQARPAYQRAAAH